MEQALQRENGGEEALLLNQNGASKASNPASTTSALASSYPRALLDLALACFASGGIGASKVRAEGVEALAKWCCVTAERRGAATTASSNSAHVPPPPPPGAVSVAALDEHLRARAAALSSSSYASPVRECRDAWMALGCLRGLRAASGKGGAAGGESSTLSATEAADAFAAAASSVCNSDNNGGGDEDESVALAALGRALLSAGRPGHAVAALEKAAGRSGSAATWMLLGRARGQALASSKSSLNENGNGNGNSNSSPSPSPASSLAAAAAFARAAQLAPDASPPWEGLALALTAAGREDLAAAADARQMPAEVLRSLAGVGGGGSGGGGAASAG